jgi:anthranilate phosphoribosyltransferase
MRLPTHPALKYLPQIRKEVRVRVPTNLVFALFGCVGQRNYVMGASNYAILRNYGIRYAYILA